MARCCESVPSGALPEDTEAPPSSEGRPFHGVFLRLRLVALLLCTLCCLLAYSDPAFALGSYTDPPGYPSNWPSALSTQAYTSQGLVQSDPEGQRDGSKGATPQSSVDFSSGLTGSHSSYFFYGNGSILYFRLRVSGPPLALTGNGQPFDSATWSILVDTDGDGFKEFVVMLDGTESGHQPDDIVVIYDNRSSQRFVIDQQGIWRQDSAGSNDGVDGATGASADWDVDGDDYVWDFRRTRVVQIDRSRKPGAQNSEYFIDVQVPLSALDASAMGGPALTLRSVFALSATSSDSNTDPTQKDVIFAGDLSLADVPIPTGDVTNSTGNILQSPLVTALAATACPSPILLTGTVLDATTVDPATGRTRDTLSDVRFEYYADLDGDGQANDGREWSAIGPAERSPTLSQWQGSWDVGGLPNGNYVVRAVASDLQGNTTYSTDQPNLATPSITGTVNSTCSQAASFDQSAKTVVDGNGGEVFPGDVLSYTIAVKNAGGVDAPNTVVRDTLPAHTTFVAGSATPTPGETGPALVWDIGTVAPGQTAIVTFQVTLAGTVPGQTPIRNTGWITSGTLSQQVAATITVVSRPQLSLVKAVSGNAAAPGDTLAYATTYVNGGSDTATGVVITDVLPSHTSYIPNSVTVNGAPRTDAADGDNVTVDEIGVTVVIGTVPAGASGEIRFLVVVK